jgi:hypothetical protein
VSFFFFYIDILKTQNNAPAWDILLIFFLWIFAVIYAVIDTVEKVLDKRLQD